MKILKNSTYRSLKADQHNLSIVVAENLELKERTSLLGDRVVDLARSLVSAENKLKRFERRRDPNGQFTKKASTTQR